MARNLSAATQAAIADAVTAAVTAALAARPAIVATPAAPTEAAQHWADRDIACPRGCGRRDFRTVNGAAGAHRNPKGATCK